MTSPIVIVGCGGFGRELHSLIDAINAASDTWTVLGYIDDGPSDVDQQLVTARGSRILGTSHVLADLPLASAVIGIGNGVHRRAIDERLSDLGWQSPPLVHPSATLGYGVTLGAGSVVCAGARLTTNIRLGRHVHVDQSVTIGHDTVVGDYSRFNPQACISGSVRVGEGVLVGANATILQGLAVGPGAVIGAGAVVVRDVPEGTTVKGVPAR